MDDVTPKSVLHRAEGSLEAAGVSNPRRNAEWMLCEALDCSLASLYARFDEPISESEQDKFEAMVARRIRHEPLQYILGYTEFYGLRITVTPDVLIPRPETEQLVEQALSLIDGVDAPRILDVGTGSGCIALAVKSQRTDASVWACDVSESALEVAAENATANLVEAAFFKADVLAPDFSEHAPGDLDLLLSNPPYVSEAEARSLPAEVRDYEPHLALFAREDPLVFYRRLSEHGRRLLHSGGWILVETHADFGRDAAATLREGGYEDEELRRDYAGRSRILCGRR